MAATTSVFATMWKECMRSRYRPAVSKDYAGDWLSIGLRDELPPEPQHEAAKAAPTPAPAKQD
jgi:hypothetical protein